MVAVAGVGGVRHVGADGDGEHCAAFGTEAVAAQVVYEHVVTIVAEG
jgi:hypothetical protein